MTVVGMWLAIAGYGLAYAGSMKLAGRSCSLIDAFRGRCATGPASATTAGVTVLASQQAQQQQQAGMIGTQPIVQVA